LHRIVGGSSLAHIGGNKIWVALAVWFLTFLAMLHHLYHAVLRAPSSPP
jgi:hypothetical protein